jgi:hypothetical protein
MKRLLRPLMIMFALTVSVPLYAHELLSVVLRLDEAKAGQVQAILKTPLARDGSPAAVVPQFQSGCQALGEPRVERQPGLILRQWRMQCGGGLAGHSLRFAGLDPRTPDAVVTARFADGSVLTAAVDRHDPVVLLQSAAQLAGPPPGLMAYLPIGIEHILLGPDHLLFVLGLMLVVFAMGSGLRMLVLALTAFTLAHSLTLALAVLGIWGLPSKPVELMIALSIVLLAVELATYETRRARGLLPSLTLRKPWLVAFVFGLLHGFGFAGALAEVGLPDQARGWALFLFNVGVEVGQLIFVAGALLVLAVMRRLRGREVPAGWSGAVVTLLGGVAVYWTLDRAMLWSSTLWSVS